MQVVDFDTIPGATLEIDVDVCDPAGPVDPAHCGTTSITFNVKDVNDNAPVFNPDFITEDIPEDATIGTEVTTFTATDSDSDVNAEFE